ncbi:MAG: hypothetical protein HYZ84_01620 [Candidatus Omnitrophica bacterium]|nr:hypothetical protein [Candidatus Omnitrophota bacterium]
MKKNLPSLGLAVLVFCLVMNSTAFAKSEASSKKSYIFSPVEESRAFQQFKTRPDSDLSRLLFLIDRFGDFNIIIRYDNYDYNAQFAARIARWFIARRYKGETVDKWIMQWCNTSIGTGSLIWVKLPDGNFRLAREVLFDEVKNLNQTLKQFSGSLTEKPLDVETKPTSLSNQLLVLPTNAPPLSAAPLASVQFKPAAAESKN